nr:hypothetical protein HK105_006893 [Polyrhizophydium stewartii]
MAIIIVFQQTHPSVFGSVSSVLDTRLPPTQVPGLERIIGVDSSTNMLVDQYGRTRLFRGVNVVYKAPPWHPATDRFDASTSFVEKTTLFNMHKRVAAAIRSVDPQAIIYFEGATWDIHNRAPTVPGGPNYANRSVLSYHYYRPPAIGSVRDTFRRRQQDAQRLGSGLFMTEFEMWWGPGNASETGALARMRETVEAADEYLQNWMGWSYKSFAQAPNSTDASLFDEATGEQRPEMARLLSRPFVSAAQGNISAMRFDEAAGVFSVTLDRREPPAGSGGDGGGSGGAVADLEISTARSTWFGGGLRVSVEPRGRSSWSFDALRQRVSVRAQAGVRRVNVTVSAA